MSESRVVIEQIFLLLAVGIIGYIAGKTKYLPANSDKVIAALVVKITAPLMIVTKMYNMEFDSRDYLNGVKLYFFAIVFVLMGYGISLIFRKICKITGDTSRIFSMQMMFGNVIYFAIPLIAVLSEQLPEMWGKGAAYAMFFVLGNDTVMWTLGISLVQKNDGRKSVKDKFKHLINANSIAFIIGMILILIGAKSLLSQNHIVSIFVNKMSDVGSMTAHLSMLFVGIMLANIKLGSVVKDIKRKYPLIIASMVKLVLLPLMAVILLKLLGEFLPIEPAKVLVLQLAMPGATIVAALAGQYDSDAEFATEGIFISTLLLVGTLPMVLWISDIIL